MTGLSFDDDEPDELLLTEEVSAIIRVPVGTLRRWRSQSRRSALRPFLSTVSASSIESPDCANGFYSRRRAGVRKYKAAYVATGLSSIVAALVVTTSRPK
jgi:hypothetical protein